MFLSPNHTQIPNYLLDHQLWILSGSQLKVFLVICRKTIGYHKDVDYVSYSQIQKLTRLSIETISKTIQELIEMHMIAAYKKSGSTTAYTVQYYSTMEEIENILSDNSSNPSENLSSTTQIIRETKETLKETSTKDNSLNFSRGRLISLYSKLYKEKAGVQAPKDNCIAKQIGNMLKERGESEIAMCLDRFFKNGFWFTRNGYSFPIFLKHYSEILSSMPKKQEEEEEDYRCPKCGKRPGGHKNGVAFCFSCNLNCVEAVYEDAQ